MCHLGERRDHKKDSLSFLNPINDRPQFVMKDFVQGQSIEVKQIISWIACCFVPPTGT